MMIRALISFVSQSEVTTLILHADLLLNSFFSSNVMAIFIQREELGSWVLLLRYHSQAQIEVAVKAWEYAVSMIP